MFRFFFMFFKYYSFFFKLNTHTAYLKEQLSLFSTIISKSIVLKNNFLFIDDFTLKSDFNVYNSSLYPNLIFFFRYLNFIYMRSKNKKLFILYLKKIIFKKKIIFLIFLNESFFFKNLTFFNKLKISKIGFITTRVNYPLLDYTIYIPLKSFMNQKYFFILMYSLLRFNKGFFFKNTLIDYTFKL